MRGSLIGKEGEAGTRLSYIKLIDMFVLAILSWVSPTLGHIDAGRHEGVKGVVVREGI